MARFIKGHWDVLFFSAALGDGASQAPSCQYPSGRATRMGVVLMLETTGDAARIVHCLVCVVAMSQE